MAGGIRLIAIDEVDLSTMGLYSMPTVTLDGTAMYEWESRRKDSVTGSPFLGLSAQTAVWNILFKPDSDVAHDALLALLTGSLGERRLLATREDSFDTRVYTMGALLRIVLRNKWDFDAQFEAENSLWRAEEASRTVKDFVRSTDQMMRIAVPGNTPGRPRIFIAPVEQRATSTIYAGWKYSRQIAITWDGPVPLVREPIRISLGNITAALVAAGKMQADGDDLRLLIGGIEQPRTVQGINTASDYVWFIAPKIDPGETVFYELIYGNSVATNPPTLIYPDAPAFDLSLSTNAAWEWPIDRTVAANAGKGLWHLFSTLRPASSDYGVPGAWRLALTNDVKGDTNAHYARSYMFMSPPASTDLAFAPFFALVGGEGVVTSQLNEYDGVELYSPMPITVARFDVLTSNPSGGAAFVFLARQSSGDKWDVVYENVSTAANVAAANYTLDAPARHIGFSMWALGYGAWDEDTYPGGAATGTIETQLKITRDDSDLQIVVGSEVECYELAAEIRVGGGGERLPPYRAIVIGNARQLTGKGTPRLMVPFDSGSGDGYALGIDCESGESRLWSATAGEPDQMILYAPENVIRPITAWSIRQNFISLPDVVESASSEFLILSPDRKTVPNGAFNTNISGWELDDDAPVNDYIISHATLGGATVSVTHDDTIGGDDLGCLFINVSASTAPDDSGVFVVNQQVFPVYGQETIDLSANVRTSTVNLIPIIGVILYEDSEGNTPIQSTSSLPYTPTATEWDGRPGSFAMRSLARSYRVYVGYVANGANRTGTVRFDDVRFIDRDLMITDESIGELQITVEMEGAYL